MGGLHIFEVPIKEKRLDFHSQIYFNTKGIFMLHELNSFLSSHFLTISYINMYISLTNHVTGHRKASSWTAFQQKDKQLTMATAASLLYALSSYRSTG